MLADAVSHPNRAVLPSALVAREDNMMPPSIPQEKPGFIQLLHQHFRKIASDYCDVLQKAESDPQGNANHLFEKGIWYPAGYFQFLDSFQGNGKAQQQLKKFITDGVFYEGIAPVKYFQQQKDLRNISTHSPMCFQLKPGVSASEAIDAIGKKLSLMDCITTYQLAAYRAFRDLLGSEKFDHLFGNDSETPLALSQDVLRSRLLYDVVAIKKEEDLKQGDLCHIYSVMQYAIKHPLGAAAGFNLMCIEDEEKKKYLGFGLSPNGLDKESVEDYLCNEFNKAPTGQPMVTEKLWNTYLKAIFKGNAQKLIDSFRNQKMSLETFRQTQTRPEKAGKKTIGKLGCIVARPNLQRIEALVQASLEDVRAVFISFLPQEAKPKMDRNEEKE